MAASEQGGHQNSARIILNGPSRTSLLGGWPENGSRLVSHGNTVQGSKGINTWLKNKCVVKEDINRPLCETCVLMTKEGDICQSAPQMASQSPWWITYTLPLLSAEAAAHSATVWYSIYEKLEDKKKIITIIQNRAQNTSHFLAW